MSDVIAEVNGVKRVIQRTDGQVVVADISEQDSPSVGRDAGGRVRVSQITTLGDYKVLNEDRTLIIETVGSGSGTYSNSKYMMEVEEGQYMIRQSRRFHPYFSGKCQIVEETFDGFGLQEGVVKRVGYFSSSPTGTYSSNYDGFWLESNGVSGTYYLRSQRNGMDTVSIPFEQWEGYEKVKNYNWDNFTVLLMDFLWLGGAALNFSIRVGSQFVILHSVEYAGTQPNVFISSPNQPMRYEIRGVSGAGEMNYICSQVGTEGSIEESGQSIWVDTGTTGIALSSIGTVYPVKAVRKNTSFRDIAVSIEDIGVFVSTANDQIRWSLHINPVLSAPLTYSNVSGTPIQSANGNGAITVTSPGTIIAGNFQSTNLITPSNLLKKNFLSFLGSDIRNNMDSIVLCISPITASTVYAGISLKFY